MFPLSFVRIDAASRGTKVKHGSVPCSYSSFSAQLAYSFYVPSLREHYLPDLFLNRSCKDTHTFSLEPSLPCLHHRQHCMIPSSSNVENFPVPPTEAGISSPQCGCGRPLCIPMPTTHPSPWGLSHSSPPHIVNNLAAIASSSKLTRNYCLDERQASLRNQLQPTPSVEDPT